MTGPAPHRGAVVGDGPAAVALTTAKTQDEAGPEARVVADGGSCRPPRLLTIMGSGETSPTMVKTHRWLLDRVGPPPVPAVILDTPFGFQENADDIAERARAYFRDSVQARVAVASFRSAEEGDALGRATFLAQVEEARYIFAGPGSPSYALRQWAGSGLGGLLVEKLRSGGAVTFASAAALTLGTATVPVYEIYKVGEPPRWLPGLDVLSHVGLQVAVIPHFNNAEGGNHDTRYCYLGERRLASLERELSAGVFVLGVDEHTGLVLDVDAGSAHVVGLGVVTVRAAGRSHQLAAGSVVPIPELAERAAALAAAPAAGPHRGAGPGGPRRGQDHGDIEGGDVASAPIGEERRGRVSGGAVRPAQPRVALADSPLLATIRAARSQFSRAVSERDVRAAVQAILALDEELAAWARDTLESDELDQGRRVLRSMVVALGRLAEAGARAPEEVLGPFVEAVLQARARARSDRRFEEADRLRDQLVALGVEVHDGPDGTAWKLTRGPE